MFEATLQTKIEFIMENIAEFSELHLFNNLKTNALSNEGISREKY